MSKHLIIIAGPTASGKTSLAIEVAGHFQTEIVSADSRQVYCELNIGVARPSSKELAAVPHHFIASHSIHFPLSAGQYEVEAMEVLNALFQEHDQVVLCGGSGLYIKAVTEGFDPLPADAAVLKELEQQYLEKGLAWLQHAVSEKDPMFYAEVDIHNHRRLLRALEVMTISKMAYSETRKGRAQNRPFQTHFFGPEWPRNDLYARINERVMDMVEAGMEEEARPLLPFRHLQALQTVGYSEWFDHFEGKITRDAAIASIQQHTRHYAKRQLTWFRNERALNPVSNLPKQALQSIIRHLQNTQ